MLIRQKHAQSKLERVNYALDQGGVTILFWFLKIHTVTVSKSMVTFGKCKLTEAEIKEDFEWAWQFAKEDEEK